MSTGDWYREKGEAQREYDMNSISREVYERRTRFAIGMIYKLGEIGDKDAAERMASAHGYDINELINEVS